VYAKKMKTCLRTQFNTTENSKHNTCIHDDAYQRSSHQLRRNKK